MTCPFAAGQISPDRSNSAALGTFFLLLFRIRKRMSKITDGRKPASAKGFGGKDSVKENRQGFLSRRYHKISELV
jgi:hypothetical protein